MEDRLDGRRAGRADGGIRKSHRPAVLYRTQLAEWIALADSWTQYFRVQEPDRRRPLQDGVPRERGAAATVLAIHHFPRQSRRRQPDEFQAVLLGCRLEGIGRFEPGIFRHRSGRAADVVLP